MNIYEAKAMAFIANSALSVPIPKAFRDEIFEDGTTVIKMENIPGETLQEVRPTLLEEGKKFRPTNECDVREITITIRTVYRFC